MSGPHTSDSDELHDICDGSLFQEHPLFAECPNALQIIMYYDDFIAVNPISPVSGKNKIG